MLCLFEVYPANELSSVAEEADEDDQEQTPSLSNDLAEKLQPLEEVCMSVRVVVIAHVVCSGATLPNSNWRLLILRRSSGQATTMTLTIRSLTWKLRRFENGSKELILYALPFQACDSRSWLI